MGKEGGADGSARLVARDKFRLASGESLSQIWSTCYASASRGSSSEPGEDVGPTTNPDMNGVITSPPVRYSKRPMVLELRLRCTTTAAAATIVTADPMPVLADCPHGHCRTGETYKNNRRRTVARPRADKVHASEDRWDEFGSAWSEREARFLSSHRAAKRAGARSCWQTRERVDAKLLRAKIPSPAALTQVTELTERAAAKEAADQARAAGSAALGSNRRPKTEPKQAFNFETLRATFMSEHQNALSAELGPAVTFSSFPLAKHIERAFISSCEAHRQSVPRYGYHGTKERNYQSIANTGFLIPGKPNAPHSANGMTHGRGVYMSKPGAAWLSRTFCDGHDLLVVATVDPHPEQDRAAAAKKPDRFIGPNIPRKIHRETPYLREVGDATIFFKTDYIVPIVIAHGAGRLDARPAVSQLSGTRGAAVATTTMTKTASITTFSSGRPGGCSPNKLDTAWVGRRQTCIAGEIAWLPAERVGCKVYMRVKRKLVSKTHSLSRGRDRKAKFAA